MTTWFANQVFSDAPRDYEGSILGFIRGLLDLDFYECWVDTVPVEPWELALSPGIPVVHLVVRPKPFDEIGSEWAATAEDPGIGWDSLRTLVEGLEHHEIEPEEVLQEQLGFSDADALSMYVVTGRHDLLGNTATAGLGWYYPLVDLYAARRFGLRRYNSDLTLVGGDVRTRSTDDSGYVSGLGEAVKEARNRLFNWYRPAPWFESGSIVVAGRDRFRPGDPVRLPRAFPPIGSEIGMRYYCVGVEHAWQWGSHYTSTLQLTRGHNAGMLDAIRLAIQAEGSAAGVLNMFADT